MEGEGEGGTQVTIQALAGSERYAGFLKVDR